MANHSAPRDALERDGILDAALGLLLERGPRRMRLAELARRLGVVPSALFYHFPGGKDEVISAMFDREESRALSGMAGAVAAADGPRERLLALATARLQNAARLRRLHGEVGPREDGARAAEIQEYVMQRRHRFLERERQMIAAILSDAPGRPLGSGSIEMLATAFQGALFNVTRTLRLRASLKSEGMLDELVDVFFAGIETRR